MILCAAGDIHGAIDRFYADVLAFEAELGLRFDHVLHVGDFGIWPDAQRIDKATRNHDGAGDFPAWYAEQRAMPRPTVFIKGNHEDFGWLARRREEGQLEVLPGLTYLPNGEMLELEAAGSRCQVGGIGGCHGSSDYARKARELRDRAQRHFTQDEVERLAAQGQLDILLLHDAPAGVEFAWRRKDGSVWRRVVSEAQGLADVVAATRPLVCFFGHHHSRLDVSVAGVPCLGLNKVGCPGNLVALEVDPKQRRYQVLGEWPPPRSKQKSEGDEGGLSPRLLALARQLVELKAQASQLGLFTDDRELLTCPQCGLAEDVLIDGRLVTWHGCGDGRDTGLRFMPLDDEDRRFSCPECGCEVIPERSGA
mgnify:CR=1 FL=1